MFVLYLFICCIEKTSAYNGRTVPCMVGRNVSISFTLNTINRDAVAIFHNSSPFVRGLPTKNQFFLHRHDERVRINAERSSYYTFTVTVSIMNFTENDAGIYLMVPNSNSKEIIDSVTVQSIATFQWITLVPNETSNSAIVLQCSSSTAPTAKFLWKLNGTLIESYGRYSTYSARLVIRNVIYNDKHNSFTCMEFESGLESDPYQINMSGPNIIKFATNVTVAEEHEWLNISCFADCYPICTWMWSKLDISSNPKRVISADNKLQLKNITRDDAGGYCCKVYNAITNTSLKGVTYLEVVYGPDNIYLNTSDTIIQLDIFETIVILCYADCFPLCQHFWTETSTTIQTPGSEIRLVHVEHDANYRCLATNPRTRKTIISNTIYVKGTSGTNNYKTTRIIPGNGKEDFPSTSRLLYAVLGLGVISSVGLLSCLLNKVRTCSSMHRAPSNAHVTNINYNGRDEARPEERMSGNYWTIVTNARGEMSTAPEMYSKEYNMSGLKDKISIRKQHASVQLTRVIGGNVDIELDDYLDPIHSRVEEYDDYIHPVHSGPVNNDFSPNRIATET